jgi:type VI protein secretion system component Hcp
MKHLTVPFGAALALLLAWNAPAPAAVDYYLKVKGINGESTDAQAVGPLPVQQARVNPGKGTIAITRYADKASPLLFKACAGRLILEGVSLQSAPGATRARLVQPVEFKRCRITSYRIYWREGAAQALEEITFVRVPVGLAPSSSRGLNSSRSNSP